MVDSFREIYIPQQMLQGEVLYKNIFAIYPPLAYYINALLLKIFNNINSIYFAGLFSTLGIIYLTYINARFFMNKLYAFSICLFIISSLILSPNVFNSFLPYSFGITYGILFILSSVYFALNKKFPFSYLFYSLAILCKYEFVFLLPLLIIFSKKNEWLKNILYFISPILITISILFLQGIRLEDIIISFNIITSISKAETLNWFYTISGIFFSIKLLPIYLINIIKFLIPVYWINYQEILIWSLPLIFASSLFKYKMLTANQKFFVFATLLISAKVFFAITIGSYGVYFIPFVLISFFILVPEKFKKILFSLLIIWSFIVGYFNIQDLNHKNNKIDNIVNYIKNNTRHNERVLVLPECLAVNVLTKRTSDNKIYSLIPLYVEVFGNNLITNRLNYTKPDYIVINNYDTSVYYYKEFGKDYAKKILNWIEKNYELETVIKDHWDFRIYKIKN